MKEFESCEKCKYRYKSDCEYPCERCVHGCVVKEYYEPMTNADRIRSMSDEELAEHFSELIKDTYENEYCKDVNDWLEWLQSEVEESDEQ